MKKMKRILAMVLSTIMVVLLTPQSMGIVKAADPVKIYVDTELGLVDINKTHAILNETVKGKQYYDEHDGYFPACEQYPYILRFTGQNPEQQDDVTIVFEVDDASNYTPVIEEYSGNPDSSTTCLSIKNIDKSGNKVTVRVSSVSWQPSNPEAEKFKIAKLSLKDGGGNSVATVDFRVERIIRMHNPMGDNPNAWTDGKYDHADLSIDNNGTYSFEQINVFADGSTVSKIKKYSADVEKMDKTYILAADNTIVPITLNEVINKYPAITDPSEFIPSVRYNKNTEPGLSQNEYTSYDSGVKFDNIADHAKFEFEMKLTSESDSSDVMFVPAVVNVNHRSMIDAYNKCPSHSGLDYIVGGDLNKVTTVNVAPVGIAADMELIGGNLSDFAPFGFVVTTDPEGLNVVEKYDANGDLVYKLDSSNDNNGDIEFEYIGEINDSKTYYIHQIIPANAVGDPASGYVEAVMNDKNGNPTLVSIDTHSEKIELNLETNPNTNVPTTYVKYEKNSIPHFINKIVKEKDPELVEKIPYDGKGDLGDVKEGEDVTYNINYENYKDIKSDVVVKTKLDPNVEYVSSDNGGTYNKDTHEITWTLKDVPAGTKDKVTYKVKVKEEAIAEGKISAKGNVQVGKDKAKDTNTVTNTVKVPNVATPELVEKVPYDGKGDLGDVDKNNKVTYEIKYKNYKDVTSDITITTTIDKNVEYVSADNDGTYDKETGKITWVIKNVPSSKEDKVSFVVKVKDSAIDAGGIKAVAEVKVAKDKAISTNTVTNTVKKPEVPASPKPGNNSGTPATNTSVTTDAKVKSPNTGESNLPFVVFGGAMMTIAIIGLFYTVSSKKKEND